MKITTAELLDYKKNWGQDQEEICNCLGYNIDDEGTDEELMASAENYENPSILFRGYDVYRHVFKNESFDENYVFWSGFMGDSLTSLFILPKTESLTWEESLERFVNKNFKRSKIIESNFLK